LSITSESTNSSHSPVRVLRADVQRVALPQPAGRKAAVLDVQRSHLTARRSGDLVEDAAGVVGAAVVDRDYVVVRVVLRQHRIEADPDTRAFVFRGDQDRDARRCSAASHP
jgi:hypothetical protein